MRIILLIASCLTPYITAAHSQAQLPPPPQSPLLSKPRVQLPAIVKSPVVPEICPKAEMIARLLNRLIQSQMQAILIKPGMQLDLKKYQYGFYEGNVILETHIKGDQMICNYYYKESPSPLFTISINTKI